MRTRETQVVRPSPAVVWHDLECGGYDADLPLWRELAAEAKLRGGPAGGAILDVGAGTGRVALALAAHGHAVTALERDPDLAAALRERADAQQAAEPGSHEVSVVEGDARTLDEPGPPALPSDACFALCIVAMQTLQLFGGGAGREAFLRGVRPHLDAGGVVACAIVGRFESFDARSGDSAAVTERARADRREYVSRATRVSAGTDSVVIERERVVRDLRTASVVAREREVTTLDRLDAARLADEAEACGLRPLGVRAVADTCEHIGSTVVILGV